MKHWSAKIYFLFSCLFAFGINMPIEYIPKFIFFWLISFATYIVYHYEDFKPFSKKNIPNVVLVIFYLWSIITIFYSDNKSQAFDLNERRLAFLLLPILCLFNTQLTQKRKYLIYFFILGNLSSILICLIHFLNVGFWSNNELRFLNFSNAVLDFKHYNYIGLNLSAGLILLLYLYKDKKLHLQFAVLIPTIVIYTLFIFLSQARMSLLTILFASVITLSNRIIHFKLYKIGSIIIIFILLLIPVILIKNPKLSRQLNSQESSVDNLYLNRNLIWKESIKLVKQKPIIGYGNNSIKLDDNTYSNSHNQILDFFLEGGIISNFLFWIFWLWLFIIRPPRSVRFYSISISALFFIALLTESLLNRIAGISLFIFIYYLFENSEGKKAPKKIIITFNRILLSIIWFVFILILPISYLTLRKVKFNPKKPKTYVQVPINQIPYYSLPGILPDNLKRGTKGFKVDNTSRSSTWSENAYLYTNVGQPLIQESDSLVASVFCYVSDYFDGTWVRISSEGHSISNNLSEYNLNNKGTWQELEISPICTKGEVPIYLYIAKYNCTSFDSLRGYVIFAYPEVRVIKKNKN